MAKKNPRLIDELFYNLEKMENLVESAFKKGFGYGVKFKDQFLKSLDSLNHLVKQVASKVKRKYKGLSFSVFQRLKEIKSIFENNFIDNNNNLVFYDKKE